MTWFWVLVHRYAGLAMAFFLVVAGLTGSVLAFHHELERWLTPELFTVPVRATPPLDPLTLRERAEAFVPQARVGSVSLERQPDEAFIAWLAPRTDPATGRPYPLRHDQLFIDPYTGEKLGSRRWGEVSLARENLLPFLYTLHYKLALPGEIGTWIFGIVALLWTLDCFVGFYLTLPRGMKRPHPAVSPGAKRERESRPDGVESRIGLCNPRLNGEGARRSFWSRWKLAWQVQFGAGPYRINYDLHRAAGLWVWAMLFVLAWSGVAFNLGEEVYTPVMKRLFEMRDEELPKRPQPLDAPQLAWREAHTVGQRLMAEQSVRHGFAIERETWLSYNRDSGVYYYAVKSSRDIGSDGRTQIAFDANTGGLKGLELPTGQYTGDTVTHWLTSLHMAKVFGLPMQVFVCLMGLTVVMLSLTGVIIWSRKRSARRSRLPSATPTPASGRSPIHHAEVTVPDP